MAKKQRPIITDPYIEVPGTTMEDRLKKYEEEKAEYARIREEEWLENDKGGIIIAFLEGIERIKNLFSKKKKQEIEKQITQTKQNQKQK